MKPTIFLSIVVLLLVGCAGGSDDGSSPGGEVDAYDLGYNPDQRWPEQGDYSYDLSYFYNGSRCQTAESFSSKAKYCMGLQDSNLNKNCALDRRQRMYGQDCGDDFQQINIKLSFGISGYDSFLGRRCETGKPKQELFKNTRGICEFFKDESLHRNCFWSDRLQEFQKLKCSGDFSPEPVINQPIPTPAPTPTPRPEPQPTPTPDDLIQSIPVVQFLKAHGMTVNVNYTAIGMTHSLPGEPSSADYIRMFFQELEDNQQDIIKFKNDFNKIEVTIYTKPSAGVLNLSYKTPVGKMREYWPLLKRFFFATSEIGIAVNFIHSTHSRVNYFYEPLAKVLALLESKKQKLKQLSSLVEEISLESYSAYFSYSKKLSLKEDFLESELDKWMEKLLPLVPVYSWAKSYNVKISSDFELDRDRDILRVHKAHEFLKKHLLSLGKAAQVGMLKEITIYYSSTEVNFYSISKRMIFSLDTDAPKVLSEVFTSIGTQADISRELQVPIELIMTSSLGKDYIKTVDMLKTLKSLIKSKSNKVLNVKLGYNSGYLNGSKALTIGYDSSLAETEKIIKSIQ